LSVLGCMPGGGEEEPGESPEIKSPGYTTAPHQWGYPALTGAVVCYPKGGC
jgi:hypothetical protein